MAYIGKVLYVFEHAANSTQHGESAKRPTTAWVSALQYKSLGVETALGYNKATEMAEFVVQKTVKVFPIGKTYLVSSTRLPVV